MAIDYISADGSAVSGTVGALLMQNNMDPGVMRPWIHDNGKSYVTFANGQSKQLLNATATLRKDEWIHLDTEIIEVARKRLKFVADLNRAGLTYTLPNGMGHSVMQYQTESDMNDASITMDPVEKTIQDRPEYDLRNLPLPVVHKDFSFTLREIMTSRNMGSPLDATAARIAGIKVAESVEKLALGVASSYTYGGGTVYGISNHPDRITYTITAPTATGWTPRTLYTEIIAAIKSAQDKNLFGDFKVYFGPAWMQYMNDDYLSAEVNSPTLQAKLGMLGNVTAVEQLDYVSSFDIHLVAFESQTIRMVNALPFQTVQWESHGGFKQNFKVLTIQVPNIRSDFNKATGLVHCATA